MTEHTEPNEELEIQDVETDNTSELRRARDGEGNLIKAESPDMKEIIDPWLFEAYGWSVNYDIRWASGSTYKGVTGIWVSTPFNRPGDRGALATKLYDEKKASGELKIEQKCFPFTHEDGVAARKAYELSRILGNGKANAKSWRNKHHAFTGISYEDLESGNMEVIEKFLQVQGHEVPEGLSEKLQEMYKKTTSTYVNKEDKLRRINKAVPQLEGDLTKLSPDNEKYAGYMEAIAKATKLQTSDVEKLFEEARKAKEEPKEIITIPEAESHDFNFDEQTEKEPTAEELEQSERVEMEEQVEASVSGDEEDEVTRVENDALVTAGVPATEAPLAVMDTEEAPVMITVPFETHSDEENFHQIDAGAPAIQWMTEQNEIRKAYLIYLPQLQDEFALPEGRTKINNVTYEVVLGKEGEEETTDE